eukprot:CAMPEP_0114539330 /NCGR_PEP_ID=MMETSP0114-20121206/180_1 /TAXON_ID=31324 /ORGANISM="Goniomonas sp, Strain m" /LENGTH=68 /DNA_ID=CAMNT_0001723425 /DNA_START=10 /DNA_END=214 /DNA_ORIENTATION=-
MTFNVIVKLFELGAHWDQDNDNGLFDQNPSVSMVDDKTGPQIIGIFLAGTLPYGDDLSVDEINKLKAR